MAVENETDKNPNIDAVIRKIQKLLTRTKGDRGATEEEADAAMNIVQGLMAKYNLDMATINAAGSGPDDSHSVRVKETQTENTRFHWQRELAKYVAEANFCGYLLITKRVYDADDMPVYTADGRKKRRPEHVFVGRKANVITAQLMFDYLCRAINDRVPVTDNKDRLSKKATSWREGCADRVCQRLALRRKDLMAEHDARVKAEEEAFAAEQTKRAEASRAKAERTLGPRPPTAKEVTNDLKANAFDAVRFAPLAESDETPERPEADPADDWQPGDNAAPEEPPPAPVTALVLASVYDQAEQDANEDILYGRTPGTTAGWRREREARYARKQAEYEAEEKEAASARAVARANETPKERARREEQEAKEMARSRRYWAREDRKAARQAEREYERLDHDAYADGQQVGKEIGLDPQLSNRNAARRLGGR